MNNLLLRSICMFELRSNALVNNISVMLRFCLWSCGTDPTLVTWQTQDLPYAIYEQQRSRPACASDSKSDPAVYWQMSLSCSFMAHSTQLRSCRACHLTYSHIFLDRLSPLFPLVLVHILWPVNNCPSWISKRGRMIIDMISWSISMKVICTVAELGFYLTTPGSAVRHPTVCANGTWQNSPL